MGYKIEPTFYCLEITDFFLPQPIMPILNPLLSLRVGCLYDRSSGAPRDVWMLAGGVGHLIVALWCCWENPTPTWVGVCTWCYRTQSNRFVGAWNIAAMDDVQWIFCLLSHHLPHWMHCNYWTGRLGCRDTMMVPRVPRMWYAPDSDYWSAPQPCVARS